ncbi:MAG TPA: hypothetical protein VM865_03800 [Acidobacteriaceae bacterium]|jgi:hypothetical protein|nr:hypothetical protein [Acidobacteriaceae bacterium]
MPERKIVFTLPPVRWARIFEVIDWPGIFGVRATPLQEVLNATYGRTGHHVSRSVLHFAPSTR